MKTLVKCFWVFIIGSFIGCLIEEIWCFIRNKCFQIRRSLIYLPLIPIYGFAALFIILIADVVGYKFLEIFLISMIVATVIEYFFSYIQEKIFHTKSWDYSNFKFNLNGRVNLFYSIGFGLIAIFIVKPIKELSLYIEHVGNNNLFLFITLIVVIIFFVDVLISTMACYRQRQRKEGIVAKNIIDEKLDQRYTDERLNKIYNNSVFIG